MAAIDWDDVEAFAPALSTVAEAAQDAILDYVNVKFDVAEFSDGEDDPDLFMARVFLAAHLGTSAAVNGATAGQVTSESAGGLSRSYAVLSSTGGLGTTGYGEQLRTLLRTVCGGPRLVP